MKKLFLSVLMVLSALSSAASAQAPAQAPAAAPAAMSKVMQSLQGNWLVLNLGGQDLVAAGVEAVFVINGDKYQTLMNGQLDETGSFKLDESKTPMTFDLTILTGNDAGKFQPGLIEIKDDVVRVGLAEPGNPNRPATIDGAEAFGIFKKIK